MVIGKMIVDKWLFDIVFARRNGGLDVCGVQVGYTSNSFHGTFFFGFFAMVFSERLRCFHGKVERVWEV